ncbi:MAG: acyl-CoA dehydrogenase family protein [Desulfomonilia bacterium]
MTELTRQQKVLVHTAHEFAQDTRPILETQTDTIAKARELYRAYARAGYHSLLIPDTYGGKGLDYTSAGIVYEILSYELPGTLHGPITTTHCAEMIKSASMNSLHEESLRSIATKGLAVGFCLTEDLAGSDISAITTSAKRVRNGFGISGKKSIVINHALCDFFIVFASSVPRKGRAGLNAFIVDGGIPGIHRGTPYSFEGFSGCVMGEVLFEDARIEAACLLGEEGSGYLLFMEILDKGRPLVAASCVGEASRALDIIVQHAKNRCQFGKELLSFQGVSLPLAELATRLQAARLLYRHALGRIDGSQSFTLEASMAKLYACEVLNDIASFGMELLGYRGIVESSLIKQIFYDAQLAKSIDGTANVQKMVIASQL